MARKNQGGSILGFVIIGGAMALLLIGGAYFVRQNASLVTGETSGIVGDVSDSDSLDEEETKDEGESDNSGTNEESEQPSEGEQVPDEEDSDTTVTDESTNEQAPHHPDESTTTSQPEAHDAPTERLPETGPADMIAASLLLSGIVGVAVAYIRSRA